MNLQNLVYNPVFIKKSKSALKTLSSLSFPNRKQEKWKYSKFSKIKKTHFNNEHSFKIKELKELLLPIKEGLVIVIENGRFNQDLSSLYSVKGLEIIPFSDVNKLVEESIDSYNESYNSYFSYLNKAYLEDGFLIDVSSEININDVINIVNINTSENTLASTRINVHLGQNSSLELKQYFLGTKNANNSFINHISEFNIADSASLKIDKFQQFQDNFNICSEFIKQGKSSFFSMNTFSNSGSFIRNDVNVEVAGEFCHTELNGVFNPNENQYIDHHTTIDHLVANCNSFENYKGIIRENGVGVFNGKVIVHQDAQKIEAFQQNNNVLINENSIVYSKPELEIYADDVKCSHGSTTGQFDDEALFYLRSRGLSRSKATQMLTIGFVNEVIEKASGKDYKSFILENLLN
jgi:Fe-S cluster assembly protein SufD